MTFSNKLTIGRIAAVPVFIFFISIKGTLPLLAALLVFIFAGLTDLYDGYLARKLGQVTKLGQFLDPIADKMIVTAALISFLNLGVGIPAWCIIVIIAREFIINDLRDLAVLKGISMPVSMAGKVKTVVQMSGIITVFVIVAAKPFIESSLNVDLSFIVNFISVLAVAVIMLITVGTGLDYIIRGLKLFGEKG